MFLLDLARICNELFADLEVHERLAAKEVDLEVVPRARILDEEIKRPLSHVKTHESRLAVELSLCCKAVGTVQVAGVRNMQAERLHDRAALLEIKCLRFEDVLREEFSRFREFVNLIQDLGGIALTVVLLALRNLCIVFRKSRL